MEHKMLEEGKLQITVDRDDFWAIACLAGMFLGTFVVGFVLGVLFVKL